MIIIKVLTIIRKKHLMMIKAKQNKTKNKNKTKQKTKNEKTNKQTNKTKHRPPHTHTELF